MSDERFENGLLRKSGKKIVCSFLFFGHDRRKERKFPLYKAVSDNIPKYFYDLARMDFMHCLTGH
jgi:hypothetical protein